MSYIAFRKEKEGSDFFWRPLRTQFKTLNDAVFHCVYMAQPITKEGARYVAQKLLPSIQLGKEMNFSVDNQYPMLFKICEQQSLYETCTNFVDGGCALDSDKCRPNSCEIYTDLINAKKIHQRN